MCIVSLCCECYACICACVNCVLNSREPELPGKNRTHNSRINKMKPKVIIKKRYNSRIRMTISFLYTDSSFFFRQCYFTLRILLVFCFGLSAWREPVRTTMVWIRFLYAFEIEILYVRPFWGFHLKHILIFI